MEIKYPVFFLILFFGQFIPAFIIALVDILVNFYFIKNLFNYQIIIFFQDTYAYNNKSVLTPEKFLPGVFFAGIYLFWLFTYFIKEDAKFFYFNNFYENKNLLIGNFSIKQLKYLLSRCGAYLYV